MSVEPLRGFVHTVLLFFLFCTYGVFIEINISTRINIASDGAFLRAPLEQLIVS